MKAYAVGHFTLPQARGGRRYREVLSLKSQMRRARWPRKLGVEWESGPNKPNSSDQFFESSDYSFAFDSEAKKKGMQVVALAPHICRRFEHLANIVGVVGSLEEENTGDGLRFLTQLHSFASPGSVKDARYLPRVTFDALLHDSVLKDQLRLMDDYLDHVKEDSKKSNPLGLTFFQGLSQALSVGRSEAMFEDAVQLGLKHIAMGSNHVGDLVGLGHPIMPVYVGSAKPSKPGYYFGDTPTRIRNFSRHRNVVNALRAIAEDGNKNKKGRVLPLKPS